MTSIRHYLLFMSCLVLSGTAMAQTMSNTDNVLTLNNTCINPGITNGSYTLELNYYDLDQNTNPTITVGVTVSISNGVLTITAPANTFPSPANNSGWSVQDAWPGHIKLTSGSFANLMFFDQGPSFNCVALPIDYNSFTGHLSSGQVVLNWQTGLEQNSTVFEVYRWSGGGGGYYKIGQVPASGNSNIPVNYTFTDAHPCSSNSYYLKELNSQGTQPIFSSSISVGCSGCTCTLPAPVNCNITINGPDHICNIETPTAYTLSADVPNFSTIAWSLDNSYYAYLRTNPNVDRGKVTLMKKNFDAAVTLRATISGCTNVIQKQVAMGAPGPTVNTDIGCPMIQTFLSSPSATSFTYVCINLNTMAEIDNTSGNFYIGDGAPYVVGGYYTNACGTSNTSEAGAFYCDPGTSFAIPAPGPVISPNPSSGIVTIGLPANPPAGPTGPVTGVPKKTAAAGGATATTVAPGVPAASSGVPAAGTTTPAAPQKIYMVRVLDAQGVLRKTFSYSQGVDRVSVNLSDLNNGNYTIQVYNKKTWSSSHVVLMK